MKAISEMIHYRFMDADNDYIYALYSGERFDQMSVSSKGSVVRIFDWDCNIIREWRFNENLSSIAVDYNSNSLFAIEFDKEKMYKYKFEPLND